MDPDPSNSLSDPFLAHLILILSIYDLPHSPSPIPGYNGPSTWQTDNILRALKTMARRMYTAEETLASIDALGNSENGPDALSAADIPRPIPFAKSSQASLPRTFSDSSAASGPSSTTTRPLSSIPNSSSSPPPFPLHNVTSLVADVEQNVNVSESHSDRERPSHAVQLSSRAISSMPISLDGSRSADCPKGLLSASSLSAPPAPHGDLVPCPLCGGTVGDSISFSKVSSAFKTSPSSGSPIVVPPGPLVDVACESGINAVEELRLLKAQISDAARVCNAVAHGDLSQKVTVPAQGIVMVQFRDVINGMVDKLGQFAKEATRVSQEVGAEGYVSSPVVFPPRLIFCASVNSVVRLLYLISKVHGSN